MWLRPATENVCTFDCYHVCIIFFIYFYFSELSAIQTKLVKAVNNLKKKRAMNIITISHHYLQNLMFEWQIYTLEAFKPHRRENMRSK